MLKRYVIVVAGGKGKRMGANNIPKQFLELSGKPILMHTIQNFQTTFSDIKIILALPKNQVDYWKGLCNKYNFTISHQLVNGGETRFHSVKNAMALVNENGVVGIHDGVRPLVNSDTITRCYSVAENLGNGIPVVDVVESLRHVSKKSNVNKAVARSCYKLVQTPQCFKSELILKAYQQEYDAAFTDDASVVERMGETINLVEGNRANIKITTQEDLLVAGALLLNLR